MATGSAGEPWAATHGRVTLLRELSRQGRPPPSGACRSPEGRVPENCSHPVRWPRGRAGEGDDGHWMGRKAVDAAWPGAGGGRGGHGKRCGGAGGRGGHEGRRRRARRGELGPDWVMGARWTRPPAWLGTAASHVTPRPAPSSAGWGGSSWTAAAASAPTERGRSCCSWKSPAAGEG